MGKVVYSKEEYEFKALDKLKAQHNEYDGLGEPGYTADHVLCNDESLQLHVPKCVPLLTVRRVYSWSIYNFPVPGM